MLALVVELMREWCYIGLWPYWSFAGGKGSRGIGSKGLQHSLDCNQWVEEHKRVRCCHRLARHHSLGVLRNRMDHYNRCDPDDLLNMEQHR